jgi:hypothetical protein
MRNMATAPGEIDAPSKHIDLPPTPRQAQRRGISDSCHPG